MSESIDNEAKLLRLYGDSRQNEELPAAIEGRGHENKSELKIRCHYIPTGISDKFFGREDCLQKVVSSLNPKSESLRRRLLLHGMGGVGKTRIALQYVCNSQNDYDAIFWISSDNTLNLEHSFAEIHRRLGLGSKNILLDAVEAFAEVREWLANTSENNT